MDTATLNHPTTEQAKAAASAVVANMREYSAPQEGSTIAGARFTSSDSGKSYKWCYYRKPDGRITIGYAFPDERVDREDMGWVALRKYGTFLLNNVRFNADGEVVANWQVQHDPYRQILERGGAKEFSLAEIVEFGWHRKPPLKGIRFPQLEGVEIKDHQCPICQRVFSQPHHLTRHESVMHKDESQNNQLARTMSEAGRGTMEAMTATVAALTEASSSQAQFNTMMAAQMERSNQLLSEMMQKSQQTDLLMAKLVDRILAPKVEVISAEEVAASETPVTAFEPPVTARKETTTLRPPIAGRGR